MSIFKPDNSSASDRFDDNQGRPTRKLDNILLDVSDDSSVGHSSANRTSSRHRSHKSEHHVKSKRESEVQYGASRYRHELSYHTRPTILPNVLATESIESMLSKIETNLFNVQAMPNLDPLGMSDRAIIGGSDAHQTETTVSQQPVMSNPSERGIEYGLTDQINNSLIQEIDMLVDKITSER
jgi:hypothetical protein